MLKDPYAAKSIGIQMLQATTNSENLDQKQ
jgi:hypothetical protein